MGFGQGLSGLNAAAQNLDVIGNNVANSSTVGFKSSAVSFGDVYATSRVGLGVSVSAVNNRFSLGTINESSNAYNMAINSSNGFFRVTDASGGVYYSRNGEFSTDDNNYIVNAQGYKLTGYAAGSVGTAPVALQVPQGSIAPVATTGIAVTADLNANATVVPATTAFDITDSSTFTSQQPVSVYDSLGNEHQVTQYFVKRDADTATGNSVYDVYYAMDGAVLTSGTPASNVTNQLQFNSAGALVSGANTTVPVTGVGGSASPAQDLALAFNYTGSTQFGNGDTIKIIASGNSSGTFTGVSIGDDGSILGSYSNGKTQVIGTVVLAGFTNMQGLQPVGNNLFAATNASGPATLGQPGSNGLATITGGALEASNVDMSSELVDMIVAQRTYQANAQTIKTQDQVLQTLLQIR